MDRISKTICIDNSRSHRNGLLPFVRFGGGGTIEEASTEGTNGNYGQYVCDFTIYSGETEYMRLRYLDVIKKYNFTQEQIRNGIFVKKYVIKQDELTKLDCEEGTSAITSENLNIFITDFDERSTKLTYEFRPLDSQYFYEKNGYYVYEQPLQYAEIKDKNDDELTDDEKALKEKIENIESYIKSENLFILLPNYDDVIKYNKEWNEWWKENFKAEKWEVDIFDGYETNENISTEFKFCYDIDSCILGRVEVVYSGSTGSKVPNYVYYTEIGNRIKWFEDNSGVTASAYENPSKETEWLIKQWEERGGGDFYNFLKNVKYTDKWQTNKEVDGENNRTFKYSPPLLNLEAIINAEIENEYLFTPYEYSVVNNLKENAVCEYSATPISDLTYVYSAYVETNGKTEYINKYYITDTLSEHVIDGEIMAKITEESVSAIGLTPQFITYDSAHTVKVESQLQTLIDPMAIQAYRDIFGSFEYFDESGVTGQMFECTYCTGWTEPYAYFSQSTITYTYKDEINDQGESTGKKILASSGIEKVDYDIIEEKCPSSDGAYQCCCVSILDTSGGTASSSTITKGDETYPEIRVIGKSFSSWTQYGWWKCVKYDGELDCADGENVEPGSKYYRNVTIVSCIDSLVGKRNVGDTYYVLARFDNGKIGGQTICDGTIKSLKIPYIPDKKLNIVSYEDGTEVYDKVVSITSKEDQGVVEIEYVKGVKSGLSGTTGVHYKDTINYTSNIFDIVPIDGVYPSELYYEALDLEKSKETVFSNEYVLNRKALRSEIIGMEVGTQWTGEGAVSALLFTKDGAEGLQEEPKYNINMLYNRGNAAAWENHFKLSECNTMEDLENYGNNFFNL